MICMVMFGNGAWIGKANCRCLDQIQLVRRQEPSAYAVVEVGITKQLIVPRQNVVEAILHMSTTMLVSDFA